MEFMLVLPLYILLMGMAFSLGEMGVKTIALASGDRVLSHAVDGAGQSLAGTMRNLMFPQDTMPYNDADVKTSEALDQIRCDKKTYRADPQFKGAWSWQSAGRAGDDYALPPWTRGWLQYPHAYYMSRTGGGAAKGAFGELLQEGAVGRTLLGSKDTEGAIRVYSYYTLKRTDKGRQNGAYRQWKNASLLKTSGFFGAPNWYENVYDEKFADADGKKLDGSSQGADSLPSQPGGSDYDRCTQLMIWSQ